MNGRVAVTTEKKISDKNKTRSKNTVDRGKLKENVRTHLSITNFLYSATSSNSDLNNIFEFFHCC